MRTSVHIVAKGLVQGVGFRYFIFRQAVAYGLTGFARNLVNGDVEVVAEGDRSLIEELIKDVKRGPRASHVTEIELAWREPSESYPNFGIR